MKNFPAVSSLISSLALAMVMSPLVSAAQTAKQDAKDAGTETKSAAKDTGPTKSFRRIVPGSFVVLRPAFVVGERERLEVGVAPRADDFGRLATQCLEAIREPGIAAFDGRWLTRGRG